MIDPRPMPEVLRNDYAILGQFIYECSMLEVCLHGLLRDILAIDEELARLLIGEPRIGDLMKLIKSAIKKNGFDENRKPNLDSALKWAEFMNGIRSIVAHKPFIPVDDKMLFHNTNTSKEKTLTWVYEINQNQFAKCCAITKETYGVVMTITHPVFAEMKFDLPSFANDEASLQKLGLPNNPGNKPLLVRQ